MNLTDVKAFPMHEVKVTDPYIVNAFEKEVAYLTSFETKRLLAGFLKTAGLDMQGYTPYPEWEDLPAGGRTLGYHLTAFVRAYESANTDEAMKPKLLDIISEIVETLLACQEAMGSGFIFGGRLLDPARPELAFDRAEEGQEEVVTVAPGPWYTMAKTLEGLTAAARLAAGAEGDEERAGSIAAIALKAVIGLGDWVYSRTSNWSGVVRESILNSEYGSMNDAMYEVYKLTGQEEHLLAAHSFDDKDLFDRIYNLEPGDRIIDGKSLDNMIPKFKGALNRYELTGEDIYLEYALSFWDLVADRTIPADGSGSGTDRLYDMSLFARQLFELTGESCYADYLEGSDSRAIFFGKEGLVAVNQYVGAQLISPQAAFTMTTEIHDTCSLVFDEEYAGVLAFRLPRWLKRDLVVNIDGAELGYAVVGRSGQSTGYALVGGPFEKGCRVELSLPMSASAPRARMVEAEPVESDIIDADFVEVGPVVFDGAAETDVAEAEVVEAEVVESDVAEAGVVELDVAEAEVVEVDVVETEAAEVEAPAAEMLEEEVEDVVEAEAVESDEAEAEVVETEAAETEVAEAEAAEAATDSDDEEESILLGLLSDSEDIFQIKDDTDEPATKEGIVESREGLMLPAMTEGESPADDNDDKDDIDTSSEPDAASLEEAMAVGRVAKQTVVKLSRPEIAEADTEAEEAELTPEQEEELRVAAVFGSGDVPGLTITGMYSAIGAVYYSKSRNRILLRIPAKSDIYNYLGYGKINLHVDAIGGCYLAVDKDESERNRSLLKIDRSRFTGHKVVIYDAEMKEGREFDLVIMKVEAEGEEPEGMPITPYSDICGSFAGDVCYLTDMAREEGPFGNYNSQTIQTYGIDPESGYMWGVTADDEGKRYRFELEDGLYQVAFTFAAAGANARASICLYKGDRDERFLERDMPVDAEEHSYKVNVRHGQLDLTVDSDNGRVELWALSITALTTITQPSDYEYVAGNDPVKRIEAVVPSFNVSSEPSEEDTAFVERLQKQLEVFEKMDMEADENNPILKLSDLIAKAEAERAANGSRDEEGEQAKNEDGPETEAAKEAEEVQPQPLPKEPIKIELVLRPDGAITVPGQTASVVGLASDQVSTGASVVAPASGQAAVTTVIAPVPMGGTGTTAAGSEADDTVKVKVLLEVAQASEAREEEVAEAIDAGVFKVKMLEEVERVEVPAAAATEDAGKPVLTEEPAVDEQDEAWVAEPAEVVEPEVTEETEVTGEAEAAEATEVSGEASAAEETAKTIPASVRALHDTDSKSEEEFSREAVRAAERMTLALKAQKVKNGNKMLGTIAGAAVVAGGIYAVFHKKK